MSSSLTVLKYLDREAARSPELRYLFSTCVAEARTVFDAVKRVIWQESMEPPLFDRETPLLVVGAANVSSAVQTPLLTPLPGPTSPLTIQTNAGATTSAPLLIQSGSIVPNGGTTGDVIIRAGDSAVAPNYNGSQLILGGYPDFNRGGTASL